MTALGSIAFCLDDETGGGPLTVTFDRQGPMLVGSPEGFATAPGGFESLEDSEHAPSGSIYGVAKIAGVIAPNHRVHLIDRMTNKSCPSTLANAAGEFVFHGLFLDAERYCVMMLDEDDAGSFNAAFMDRLTATSA